MASREQRGAEVAAPRRIGATLPLGRLGSVPVRLHVGAVAALPLFGWLVAARMRSVVILASVPGGGTPSPWTMAALATAAMAVALVVHQASHVLVARIAGGRTRTLTIGLLAGCSEADRVRGLGAQVAVALAGPLASLSGGVACQLIADRAAALPLDARFALVLLAQAQVALGVFDLLPAPPLDGGRAMHALLAARLDRARAARVASAIGRASSAAAAVTGVVAASPLTLGVAAILWAGAERSAAGHAHGDEALARIPVRALLEAWPIVDGDAVLSSLAARMQLERATRFLVTDSGLLLGLAFADEVARVPVDERPELRVRAITHATPTIDIAGVARKARALLHAAGARALCVVDRGLVVGVVTDAAIAEAEALARLHPVR
jgi:Zn-dependent protease